MSRISFFSMLADSKMSFTEGGAINAALDRGDAAMQVAQAQGDAFGGAIAQLQGRVGAQEREIKLLRAAVGVLAAMLRDNGIVDGEILDLRLEAAIANAEEEIEVAANTITCPQCHRQVDRRITVMTEQGVVCDRCHALGA
jgi:Zn finger protein HypA/HybF involved in hydrogenase expression